MASQLNIKDPETIRKARRLAETTGSSITEAVSKALDGELRRLAAEHDKRVEDFCALMREVWDNPPAAWRDKTSEELMDALYDENGLPV